MQIIYITEITHLCTAHVRGVFCELSKQLREGKQNKIEAPKQNKTLAVIWIMKSL